MAYNPAHLQQGLGVFSSKPRLGEGQLHQDLFQILCFVKLASPKPQVPTPKWEFPKIRGTLFWGPYNKDSTI